MSVPIATSLDVLVSVSFTASSTAFSAVHQIIPPILKNDKPMAEINIAANVPNLGFNVTLSTDGQAGTVK